MQCCLYVHALMGLARPRTVRGSSVCVRVCVCMRVYVCMRLSEKVGLSIIELG